MELQDHSSLTYRYVATKIITQVGATSEQKVIAIQLLYLYSVLLRQTNWLNGYCSAPVRLPAQVNYTEGEDAAVCAQGTHTRPVSSLLLCAPTTISEHIMRKGNEQQQTKKKKRTEQGFSSRSEHITRRLMSAGCSSTFNLFQCKGKKGWIELFHQWYTAGLLKPALEQKGRINTGSYGWDAA